MPSPSIPARGAFILLLLAVAIGGSLALYALRAPTLTGGGIFAPISREGALVLNNLLLATGAATVFIGTLYPLFLDAVGGDKVSVGFPFFNRTFVPLMVPLLLAIPIGPLLGWKRGDLAAALQRLAIAAGAALTVAIAVIALVRPAEAFASLGLGLAAWIGVGALVEWSERMRLFRGPLADSLARARSLPRASHGMTLAHLGVAVTVAGIAASAWAAERIELMRPGDSVAIAGYDVRLDKIDPVQGENYTADRGTFTASRNGSVVAVLAPERRFFTVQQMPVTFSSIHTNLLADLYVVLGRVRRQGRLDRAHLSEAPGAVDLARLRADGIGRPHQPLGPALARRRRGAQAKRRARTGRRRLDHAAPRLSPAGRRLHGPRRLLPAGAPP